MARPCVGIAVASFQDMNVTELMTLNVHTCRTGDTLADAARILWDQAVSSVLVVDDEGHLVGTLSDRDVCMGAFTTGRPLHAITAEHAMVRDVATCAPNESVHDAEERMRERHVHHLPVVDANRRPIGVLSIGEMARHFQPAPDGFGSDLAGDRIALVMAGIAEPPPISKSAH